MPRDEIIVYLIIFIMSVGIIFVMFSSQDNYDDCVADPVNQSEYRPLELQALCKQIHIGA